MQRSIRKSATLCLALCLLVSESLSESVDSVDDSEKYCYPELHNNTRKSCECRSVSTEPWGMHALHIDCSYKAFKYSDLTETLPLFVQNVDLSWNDLNTVPLLISDSLNVLNVMHNNISILTNKNFNKLPNLKELYLNWNSIQVVESQAFAGLDQLLILDLSHNNINSIDPLLFAPLQMLEFLSLSWNRQLSETQQIQSSEFYSTFNVNTKLKTLKLQACNLTSLNLNEQASLIELDLRFNNFDAIPANLPKYLEKFDFSNNPLKSLDKMETRQLTNVKEFYLEDMPQLERVEEKSLASLESLKKLSFQNCQQLTYFHESAFGQVSDSLKSLIFRGASLSTFNESLSHVFDTVEELDLVGLPLHCDCQLEWLASQHHEGQCHTPYRLRGYMVTSLRHSDFKCDTWPRWLYGVILFVLIVLCSGGIYLIVLGLRPKKKVQMRSKVGSNSPYARITIEPNQQEH